MEDVEIKMDLTSVIRVLAEYVMLNSTVTDSVSLFYGRAGMSLCLFNVARFLNDKSIENHAFNLLMQSLLNEKEDIRFDTGLPGIGYALNYVIRYKFVEADFYEIFGNRHEIIVREFLKAELNAMSLRHLVLLWQTMPYFIYMKDERIKQKTKDISKECISRFEKIWKTIHESSTPVDKEMVLEQWRIYLKVLSITGEIEYYNHIIDYILLLRNGLLKSDMLSLHYISNIMVDKQNGEIKMVLNSMMKEDILQAHSVFDYMFSKNIYTEPYISHNISFTDSFLYRKIPTIEKTLNQQIGFSSFSPVLSFGISGVIVGLLYSYSNNKSEIKELLSLL